MKEELKNIKKKHSQITTRRGMLKMCGLAGISNFLG